jgi:hypothetical protein
MLAFHREGRRPMCYFRSLAFSASFLLSLASAGANVLTPADYQSFQDLDVKMLSVGDDLYALMTTRAETNAPDCLMQLAFKFDAVQADLHRIRTLVGIAASMTDNADEMRVIRQLNLAAWGFIEQLKFHRLILSSIAAKCNEKDVGSKGQEISRAWNEAAALIQSMIKKIGASSP